MLEGMTFLLYTTAEKIFLWGFILIFFGGGLGIIIAAIIQALKAQGFFTRGSGGGSSGGESGGSQTGGWG